MADDTKIGGPGGKFPATRWSAVVAARSADPAERKRALETIIAAYWKPIYKYIRIRWGKSNEDAQDLTQQFFLRVIEKNDLVDFDPGKARLRTFLRVCADHFVANEAKAATRQKRGGGAQHISLDFQAAETELARAKPLLSSGASPESMDEFLEREFLRSLFGVSVESLRQFCEGNGKKTHFRLFEIYVVSEPEEGDKRPGYKSLASRFGIAETDVTNYLAYAKREFRRILLEKLREMTISEEEFRREARAMLGVDVE
jgi:DNA-directed RNA polymerase specialized sigma24 family protein